ncbi:threonine/homoserine efflux transporter RhtA [Georgenia soli]|uniref:Threonine/homoserine efflux transporter RhtA n=1 Tax=Georgenia soli TaxID=638953 RepID=A0A2A9EJD8_9MICO|nr:DMT family transporter [Georgenia soli]PFG38641.1 threonine/homoserine efflux transporter RhtA [Georgenia soli]
MDELTARRATGLWLALVSAAAFGTSGSLAKSLLETGWTPGAAVLTRIGGAALLLAVPAVLALRGRWHLLRRHAGTIAAYGLVAMAACQLFYFNAVTTLSVGVALLLEYLGPVLVVGWLWLRHGRRPRRFTLLGIVLSLAGLVLVLDVTGGMRVDPAGAMWGLGAAVGLAVYFVLSAHETSGLPPIVMAAGGMVVATAALALAGLAGVMPLTWSTADVRLAGTALPWFVPVVLLVVVAAALAYALGIAGTRRLGSTVAAFVGLSEVLFSVLFAWLLLGELPLPVQLLGGVLIVGGVVAVRYDELRRASLPALGVPAPETV